jgi:ubiquinone biosynthesis protein UbiJ
VREWKEKDHHREERINIEKVSLEDQLEAIKSFQSTIRKLEKALAQMTEKGVNTNLVKKRFKAACIGLDTLEYIWNQKLHHYSPEELTEARQVLIGLFPSIENTYDKLKAGSPQRTLLDRRLKALELAVEAIDDCFNK